MHWAMGENEMARRANAVPFAITAAKAEPYEQSWKPMDQQGRTLEDTFEGQDLRNLGSPFNDEDGNDDCNKEDVLRVGDEGAKLILPSFAALDRGIAAFEEKKNRRSTTELKDTLLH